mmetsp:Transcript_7122/g.29432  ORF Transcript_7122/g.29432 Transcript_7122/m.29432 type:complete len:337 (+) Transcript_7122:651-1661(+)
MLLLHVLRGWDEETDFDLHERAEHRSGVLLRSQPLPLAEAGPHEAPEKRAARSISERYSGITLEHGDRRSERSNGNFVGRGAASHHREPKAVGQGAWCPSRDRVARSFARPKALGAKTRSGIDPRPVCQQSTRSIITNVSEQFAHAAALVLLSLLLAANASSATRRVLLTRDAKPCSAPATEASKRALFRQLLRGAPRRPRTSPPAPRCRAPSRRASSRPLPFRRAPLWRTLARDGEPRRTTVCRRRRTAPGRLSGRFAPSPLAAQRAAPQRRRTPLVRSRPSRIESISPVDTHVGQARAHRQTRVAPELKLSHHTSTRYGETRSGVVAPGIDRMT